LGARAGCRYSPACTQTRFGLKQTAPSLAQYGMSTIVGTKNKSP